jgi:hypothetical protein
MHNPFGDLSVDEAIASLAQQGVHVLTFVGALRMEIRMSGVGLKGSPAAFPRSHVLPPEL